MTTLTKATNPQLQRAQPECIENRRVDHPITPYRRGFAVGLQEQVYANPYRVGSDEADEYYRGYGDARLMHYLSRTCLRADETEIVDRLLLERGRTAQVERVCLKTGAVLKRFTIGHKANSETEWLR